MVEEVAVRLRHSCVVLSIGALLTLWSAPTRGQSKSSGSSSAGARAQQWLSLNPLSFVPVTPQEGSAFTVDGAGFHLRVSPTTTTLKLARSERDRREPASPSHPRTDELRLELLGANASAPAQMREERAARANFLLGNDPRKWRANVPMYGRVVYGNAYPGIDLVHYGKGGTFEHDFVVHPGADPRKIRFRVSGARDVRLNREGALVLTLSTGDVRLEKPLVFQERGNRREIVRGRYVVRGGEISFEVGSYDRRRTLIIDPVLAFSTYMGTGYSSTQGVAADASGNVYAAIDWWGSNAPAGTHIGPCATVCSDALVIKFNPQGTATYVTYIGGSQYDGPNALAVDTAGQVWVAGQTTSTDFPLVNPLRATPADIFVAELDATGSTLLYATYLGGSALDYLSAMSVVGNSAYLAGTTYSTDFPVQFPFQTAFDRQVLRSADGGATWAPSSSGLPSVEVDNFSLDPITGYAYASTVGGGVAVTHDQGLTWQRLPWQLDNTVMGIAIAPSNSNVMYAATSNYVGKTTDGGATTATIGNAGLTSNWINSVAVDPTNENVVYAAEYGVSMSADGGDTWTSISGNLTDLQVTTVAVDPNNSNIVYVGNSTGVYAKNGANGWGELIALNNVQRVIAASFNTQTWLYAIASCMVYVSADAGTTWSGPTVCVDSLYVDPSNPQIAYGASRPGVLYKTTDSGQTWTDLSGYFPAPNLTALAVWPTSPETVVVSQSAEQGFLTKLDGSGGLAYSTYVGMSGMNSVAGVATDTSGNAYIVGTPGATDFPVTAGAFQSSFGPGYLLSATAAGALRYSTFLPALANDVALDENGKLYLTGNTYPNQLPVTGGAFQSTTAVPSAYLMRLSADATTNEYATYLSGATGYAFGRRVRAGNGVATVVGTTFSTDFPVVDPLQGASGMDDVFVSVLDTNASGAASLLFSTYLGGSDRDYVRGLAVAGNTIAVSGDSYSSDYPLLNAWQTSGGGGTYSKGFLSRIARSAASTDLSLTISGPETAVVNSTFTYTLTVQNGGSSNSDETTITDPLPSGVTLVSADSACTGTSVLTCSLGTLVPNATASVSITVTPTAQGRITNNATVAFSGTDPTLANNSASKITTVSASISTDLSVMLDGPTSAVPLGGANTVTYTAAVGNAYPGVDATGVTITLATATGFVVDVLNSSGDPDWTCTASGQVLCQFAGVVLAGSVSPSVVISGHFDPSTLTATMASATVTTTATASAASNVDTDPANDAHSVSTTVIRSADLQVSSSVGSPIAITGPLQFQTTIRNTGPNDAPNVLVTYTLPDSSYTLLTSTYGTGSCVQSLHVITCSPGTLATAAGAATYTVQVVPSINAVAGNVSSAIVSVLTHISSTAVVDPQSVNDNDPRTITIQRQSDLAIVSVSDNGPLTGTGPLNLTTALTNNGPDLATNVSVVFTVPTSGFTLSSAGTTFPQGCVQNGVTISCPVGSVASGSGPTYVMSVAPDSSSKGTTVISSVQIGSSSVVDASTTNNSTTNATAWASADVSVSGVATPSTLTMGSGDITFTFTVANAGPNIASAAQFSTGSITRGTVVSATPSSGTCSMVTVVSCALGQIDVGGTATVTLVVTPISAGSVQVFGAASSTEVDLNTNANSTTVTATVLPPSYLLSVSVSGTGTVTSSPAGISCAPTCSATFTYGSLVDLTAVPAAGATFAGWSGAGCSGTGTCTVAMTSAQSLIASFSQTPTVDLAIQEWDTSEQLLVGATYVYRYTVSNAAGKATATNVLLVPTIPTGATLTSTTPVTGAWTCDLTGRCSLPALAAGGSATVEFRSRLDAAGSQVYSAMVSSAEGDADTSNNFTSETNTILGIADVSVVVGTPQPGGGDIHVHTVTVFNKGPQGATNVTVTDAVTGDVVVGASAAGASCTYTPMSVSCLFKIIPAGTDAVVTITAHAADSGWTSHLFGATAHEYDPIPVNNSVRISADADANTQPGTGVNVRASDAVTGAVASVTFATVTQAGKTVLSMAQVTGTLPPGYRTGKATAMFDVRTSAGYTGVITVSLPLHTTEFRHPARARLFHFENGVWVDRTAAIDLASGTIAALTASLSPFALFEPADSIPVANAGADTTFPGASSAGATIVLDGSASSDADSDALTYRWTGQFPEGGGTVTGARPAVTLPFGTSQIVLVVNDGEVDSAPVRINVSVADFAVTAANPTATVQAAAATYTIAIAPKFGPFNAPVSFACSGLPVGMSCSFSPATVTPGSAGATTALSVSTSALAASKVRSHPVERWKYLAIAFAPFGFIAMAGTGRRKKLVLLAVIAMVVVLGMIGCGGGAAVVAPAAQPQTHQSITSTITVTATSAGVSHSTELSLTLP